MTRLFMYRLSDDTGLAPCVQDGLLSLAVCKGGQIRNGKSINTGLRYWIGSRFTTDYKKDKVYILGTYHNKFLFIANITEVMTMEDYYHGKSKNRLDNLYSLNEGSLHRNRFLFKEGIHTQEQVLRDIAGKYVLLSDKYIYLGRDAIANYLINKYGAKTRETKEYTGKIAEKIINECEQYRDYKVHFPHNPLSNCCGASKWK